MTKTTTPKQAVPKPVKSTVKLISYTMKAVIPTGPYANIQPEISFTASSLQEAQDYIVPHLDGLFERYLNVSERPKPRVTVTETVPKPQAVTEVPKTPEGGGGAGPAIIVETFTPVTVTGGDGKTQGTPGVTINVGGKLPPTIEELQAQAVVAPAPVVEVVYPDPNSPMGKAKLAVESCKSIEALNLIDTRIKESVKLDELDKTDLDVLVKARRMELSK